MSYRTSPRQAEKQAIIASLHDIGNTNALIKTSSVPTDALREFVTKVQGKVVIKGMPGYMVAKSEFNNIYPAFPYLIVYVASVQDVRLCLEFANKYNIWTVARSSGHSLADYSVCDNGMVIDLSEMTNVFVDPVAKTAVVDSGVSFEILNPAIELHKLHVPGGGCPTVTVAGFMQGGGYGLTSRTFGMNCDCVLEVTVMLADGTIVVANKNQNSDLYWAIRGGTGGNFGILLTVKYQLFDLDLIWGIEIDCVVDDTNYANSSSFLEIVQNRFALGTEYTNMGIETVLSRDTDTTKKIFFLASWIGSEADLDAAVAPLLAIPGAILVQKLNDKYSAVNGALLGDIPKLMPSPFPPPPQAFSRSAILSKQLSASDWAAILKEFFTTAPNIYNMIDLELYGATINKLKPGDNAFIHRDGTMDIMCDVFFNDATNDREANRQWIMDFFKFLEAYTNTHSYQNYPFRDQEDFRWAYWGVYYNQLVDIKKKYDPTGFFHYQQCIGPDHLDDSKGKQISIFTPTPIVHENY